MKSHTLHPSMRLFLVISGFMLFGAHFARAQNMSVNATGAQPDPSAMLDVQSTSQGMLIPRMTAAQRAAIVSPADGLMIYQTDGSSGLYIFDGAVTDWVHSLDSTDVAAVIAAASDNLGNHSMTQDFQTNGFSISNDGDVEGISIALDGRVNVTGATAGAANLTVNGLVRTTGQGSGLEITNNQIQITGNNGNSGDLRLRTGGADRVYISNTGQVGIGTSSPSSLLHVNSGGTTSTIRLTNSATASLGLWLQSDNLQSYFLNYENTPMKFATNGADRMTIAAGGNVGIGTTNPTSALEVNGDVEIPSTNAYTYSTAKTHYQSFAPTTFNSLLPDVYAFGTNNAANFYAYFRSGGTAFGYSTVEVNLPDNAVITGLRGWFYDNLNTNPVRVELMRQALGSDVIETMATVETGVAFASTAVQDVTDITINNPTVDNQNYAYFLFFTGRQNSTETRLYGSRITYTVTETD